MNFELEKAKKELYDFLEQNPQLIPMQNALTAALDSAGDDPYKRFLIFKEFLHYNLSDLQFELGQLKEKLDGIRSTTNDR